MAQITRQALTDGLKVANGVSVGKLQCFDEKIMQFGEGNFLRAFVDWMVDEANTAGVFGAGVAVVQPIDRGMVPMLNEQGGVYTLFLRGMQNGEVVQKRQIVTCITRGFNPYEQWKETIACACQPSMRIFVSNTTEAGITHSPESYDENKCPNTFPAKVTALLYARYKTFSGAADKGLILIPCELIDRNGDNLKKYVLQYAAEWNLPGEFAAWVENANYFLNTLVDRIVPGYPREEVESIQKELGYEDKQLDTGEIFHLWVIEGPEKLKDEFPLHKAGLNVVWTDDMAPYRTQKVRVLNGAHTSNVLASFLGGVDTVGEMMEDKDFGRLVQKAVFDEILPALKMEAAAKKAYAESVMERFRNPFIRHELLSISLNSVSKWKVRVLPSFLDYQKEQGKLPQALTFSLAALISFYKGKKTDKSELAGERDGAAYPIRDDAEHLDYFSSMWEKVAESKDYAGFACDVLKKENMWAMDLTTIPGMCEAVAGYLQQIQEKGSRATVQALLG